MVWVHINKEETTDLNKIISQIEKESDRAAGIVMGSFVEDHLTSFIKSRLRKDQKVITDIFKPDAPLGQFASKIRLGYLMNFYPKEAFDELITIKNVRNTFAHDMTVDSFDEQRIKAYCKNLVLWKKIKIHISQKERPNKKNNLIIQMGENISNENNGIFIIKEHQKDHKLTAREQFMNACQFFTVGLAVLINEQYPIHPEGFQTGQKS